MLMPNRLNLSLLAGMGGQTSKNEQEDNSKQIWFMSETSDVVVKDMSHDTIADKIYDDNTKEGVSATVSTHSPKIFLSDDNIINTQDSENMDVDGSTQRDKDPPQSNSVLHSEETNQVQERRRSDRLKKDTPLTNVDEVERNAQKTNLEVVLLTITPFLHY